MTQLTDRLRFSGRYASETEEQAALRRLKDRKEAADLIEELTAALEEARGRDEQLNHIADVIDHWIGWTTREHEKEGLAVTLDTHIILPGDNAPPYWPSVGQLARWLQVLRCLTQSKALARVKEEG